MTIENVPSAENPKTGRITALSLLRVPGLVSPLKGVADPAVGEAAVYLTTLVLFSYVVVSTR